MKKIKVVWLCHFSNSSIHNKLNLKNGWVETLARKVLKKNNSTDVPDFAVWITNGISEIEKLDEVELHVVSPYPHLEKNIQEFKQKGVTYHFFKNEEEALTTRLVAKMFAKRNNYNEKMYFKNRKAISNIISKINPDIVHLFGAENPYYALAILDVPTTIPTIAQLQTLLCDPNFKENCIKDDGRYQFRATIERKIINTATFIGTASEKYRTFIRNEIKSNSIFLNTTFAVADPLFVGECTKKYDFVYFAADIQKACDLALEAFGRAYQTNPSITLDVIGSYDLGYKGKLDEIINRFGIAKAVFFEGKLLTHDDVLCQIRKARFALLPLRIDLTSGTIREAMSNGLPVVTTDTGELGTQKLNKKRQNVLISPIGAHQELADNMLRLLNNEALADSLRQNAYQTRSEVKSNEMVVKNYLEAYMACIDNFKEGVPIPEALTRIK